MDLSKLSPAPWEVRGPWKSCGYEGFTLVSSDDHIVSQHDTGTPAEFGEELRRRIAADFAFAALARNAFDVMMRRGWHAYFDEAAAGWFLGGHHGNLNAFSQSAGCFPDPFTALVAADEWYKDNVESR